MNRFEAFTGSAMWMAVSVLLAAAALEPVTVGTPAPGSGGEMAGALCADRSATTAPDCASARL